jgi:hypothetical protein
MVLRRRSDRNLLSLLHLLQSAVLWLWRRRLYLIFLVALVACCDAEDSLEPPEQALGSTLLEKIGPCSWLQMVQNLASAQIAR